MWWRKLLYRMAARTSPHSPSGFPVSSYQATFGGIHEFIVISTAVQYSSFGFYSSLILSGTLMWIWEAAKMGLNASRCYLLHTARYCPLTVACLSPWPFFHDRQVWRILFSKSSYGTISCPHLAFSNGIRFMSWFTQGSTQDPWAWSHRSWLTPLSCSQGTWLMFSSLCLMLDTLSLNCSEITMLWVTHYTWRGQV